MFVEVVVKYILLFLLDIVKLLIYFCGRPCKIHITILQGLPQTYIHSLTRSDNSSKMYLARTSTKVY
jgi:hypothetical protein